MGGSIELVKVTVDDGPDVLTVPDRAVTPACYIMVVGILKAAFVEAI